jgi:hypothetical protein
MPFTLIKRHPYLTQSAPGIISWNTPCHFCDKPIGSGYPLLMLSPNQAAWIGVSHVECGYQDFRYAQFRLHSPGLLDKNQISFLAHFYPGLFKLPGWGQPTAALRRCLALILLDFPAAWSAPVPLVHKFIEENNDEVKLYPGDLEADYFKFLGEVQKSAQEYPLNLELNFPDQAMVLQ